MIAADTSSLIALLSNPAGDDVERLTAALLGGTLVLPPVVLTEILSDEKTGRFLEPKLRLCPMLEITAGYWARAGAIRAMLLAKGLRAKIPDALIAQSCIDHDVPLITRDADFRHFAKHCGLKLT